jgi:hypothetical protein
LVCGLMEKRCCEAKEVDLHSRYGYYYIRAWIYMGIGGVLGYKINVGIYESR